MKQQHAQLSQVLQYRAFQTLRRSNSALICPYRAALAEQSIRTKCSRLRIVTAHLTPIALESALESIQFIT